jgi:hypothetical protein
MKSGRFHYSVQLELELTGLELAVIQYHASQHYKSTCRSFFEHGHTGFSWIAQFRWANDGKKPADAPTGTVTVEISSRELGLVLEIIDRLGHDETRAAMKDILGLEVSNDEMEKQALELRDHIREAVGVIQGEWKRLDEAASPTPARKYWPLGNVLSEARCPKESPEGPWLCVGNLENDDYEEFLEVHQSARGDGVVLRISEFNGGRISLGRCVVLDEGRARQVRNRFDLLLNQLEPRE